MSQSPLNLRHLPTVHEILRVEGFLDLAHHRDLSRRHQAHILGDMAADQSYSMPFQMDGLYLAEASFMWSRTIATAKR